MMHLLLEQSFALDPELPIEKYVDKARALERHLVDSVGAATRCHELCESRVRKLQLAIESDLFEEFDEEQVARLKDLAASVRVKHSLLLEEFKNAHRLANECDEIWTARQTTEQIDAQDESIAEAEGHLREHLGKLIRVHTRSLVLGGLLKQDEQDQLVLFERMRR